MTVRPHLRAIFFDLDGTLYDSATQIAQIRRYVAGALKKAAKPGSRLSAASEEDIYQTYERISREQGSNSKWHINALLDSYGEKPVPAMISAGLMAYQKRKHEVLRPYEETIPLLQGLKEYGLLLGVITNGVTEKQWDKLNIMGLSPFFDTVVVSQSLEMEHGILPSSSEKPHPFPYSIALQKLNELPSGRGIQPQETLYVDDRVDNLIGANSLGIHTVWFTHGKYSVYTPEKVAKEKGLPEQIVKPKYAVDSLDKLQSQVILRFQLPTLDTLLEHHSKK